MAKDNFLVGNRAGLRLAVQLTGWLAGPLVAALFLGRWLDDKYHTSPWLFLICVGAAFAVTIAAIVKETIGYIREIEEAVQDKNKKEPLGPFAKDK